MEDLYQFIGIFFETFEFMRKNNILAISATKQCTKKGAKIYFKTSFTFFSLDIPEINSSKVNFFLQLVFQFILSFDFQDRK